MLRTLLDAVPSLCDPDDLRDPDVLYDPDVLCDPDGLCAPGASSPPDPDVSSFCDPEVEIRPARPDDDTRIKHFVMGLSSATRTLRFFTGISRPSAGLVRAMTVRNERRDVLLALVGDIVVGHAMSHLDGTAVEIAVVVGDEWQNIGIGSRLVRALIARAVERGATTIGMDVMGSNQKVLSMVRRAWPDATMKVEAGSVELKAGVIFAEQGSVESPLTS